MTKERWMKATGKIQKDSLGKPGDYQRFLSEIKERIRSAQYKVLNKE